MPATKEQLQRLPKRFSTSGVYKVTAYNGTTKVSTCVSQPNLKPDTLSLLLDKVPTVNAFYFIGVEEPSGINPNNSDAVVQKGTIIGTVTPIDTLVYYA